jgi:hypothetical protein
MLHFYWRSAKCTIITQAFIQHYRPFMMMYDSLTQSLFFFLIWPMAKFFFLNTMFQEPALPASSGKKYLTRWTPKIEQFSINGYCSNTQLAKINTWEQIKSTGLLHKIHKRKINTTYDHINAINGMLHDDVYKLPLCYLLSKCHTVSQFVHSIIF